MVWRSAALLGWLVAAAVFNVVYKPARRGRKVAYLTVARFVFLVASLAVRLTVSTEHGKQADKAEASATRRCGHEAATCRLQSSRLVGGRARAAGVQRRPSSTRPWRNYAAVSRPPRPWCYRPAIASRCTPRPRTPTLVPSHHDVAAVPGRVPRHGFVCRVRRVVRADR